MTDRTGLGPTFPLGRFDVHRIGFGAMQLPGRGVMGPPKDHDQAVAVLRRAVELGVNHIDTAQYYGPDVANELIREALHPYPDDLALVSKVGAVRDAKGGWPPAQQPAELRAGVEDNLRSLKIEQLAAVNLRITDPVRGYQPPPLEDQLAEMVNAAGGGQDRRHRHLQRHPRAGGDRHRAGRHRLRAERVQPGRPQATIRCWSGAPPRASRTCRSSLSARPFPACRR